MSIEVERNSCPYCSTPLRYCYINLTEKMLMCTKEKCLFPFDVDDVSPYIIRVDSLVNGNNIAGPLPPLPSSSSSSSSSSSPILLKDKFLSLKTQSKPTSNLKSIKSKSKSQNSSITEPNSFGLSQNNVLSTRSKNEISNLSTSKSLSDIHIEPSSINKSNNLPANSKSINARSSIQSMTRSNNNDSLIPLNEVVEVVPEESISNSNNNNNTITLKTLGVTLKVDQPNKNKLQSTSSSQFNNGLSTDITKNNFSISTSDAVTVEKDLTPLLFNMNDFPVSVVEGSSADITNPTTGNGLLNANTTNEVDGNNILTVEEYSKMLFGQSDIDINFDLDNMLPNFNTMGVNMQGNDANMENTESMDLDEFLGTIDSLESSKLSGNDMNLDFDSFMASLGGTFTGVEMPNDMSGNNLNVDLNSIPVNTNGMNGINGINGIQNGHLDNCSEVVNRNSNGTNENHNTIIDSTLESINGQNGYHENVEKTKNGVNGLNDHNTLVNLTLGNLVNGQNGYHESVENGVNGLVEDEGKNVVGKTINGDSVTLVT